MASIEGDIGESARVGAGQTERGGSLQAVSDAARRRSELMDAVFAGRARPGRAAEMIDRDSARLDALAAGLTGRRSLPARLAVIRIRPAGWRLRLWIPVPMFIVRFAAGLAGRHAAAIEGLDARFLTETLRTLPRCGKVVEIQVEGHSVEVWLL